MTEFEKIVLEKLDTVGQEIGGMKRKIESMDQKINNMDLEIGSMKQEMEVMGQKIENLDKKVTKIQITIENDISKKIDIIGEGHDFLKQRLDEAMLMEKKRENMELELVNHRMEIKKIKEDLDIA